MRRSAPAEIFFSSDVDKEVVRRGGTPRSSNDTIRLVPADVTDRYQRQYYPESSKRRPVLWFAWSTSEYQTAYTDALVGTLERDRLLEDSGGIEEKTYERLWAQTDTHMVVQSAALVAKNLLGFVIYKDGQPFTGRTHKLSRQGRLLFTGKVKDGFLWDTCAFYNTQLWHSKDDGLRRLISPVYMLFDIPIGGVVITLNEHAPSLNARRAAAANGLDLFSKAYGCRGLAYEYERTRGDYDRLDFNSDDSNAVRGETSGLIQKYYERVPDRVPNTYRLLRIENEFARINKDSVALWSHSQHELYTNKNDVTYHVVQDLPLRYNYSVRDSIRVQNYDERDFGKNAYGLQYPFSQYKIFILSPDSKRVLKLIVHE